MEGDTYPPAPSLQGGGWEGASPHKKTYPCHRSRPPADWYFADTPKAGRHNCLLVRERVGNLIMLGYVKADFLVTVAQSEADRRFDGQ